MSAITITNAGQNLMRDAMIAGTGALPIITWVGVGTSVTAPAVTDTQLGAEVFRKQLTSAAPGASAGEGLFTLYLAPQDCVGVVIGEVGFFAGPATAAANSGILVAHALYPGGAHTKLVTEALQEVFDSII